MPLESILSSSGLQSGGLTSLSGGATFGGGITTTGFGGGFSFSDAVGGATSVIGGVNFLGDLLGVDIMANISNVLTYGLSSWGAGTDPQKEQTRIKLNIDKLQVLLSGLNDSNIENNINEMELISSYLSKYYSHLVSQGGWAGSTAAAYKLHRDAFLSFRSSTLAPLISKLKSNGYKFTNKTTTRYYSEFVDNFLPWKEGSDNRVDTKSGQFSYNIYEIQVPLISTELSENGDLKASTGGAFGFGLVGLALLFGGLKLFKIIK